ncbi:MAG: hypothetical protein AB1405_06850 [Bdellovibrionota bacterium]
MTQVPQISRKNDDRLDRLAGLSAGWTVSYGFGRRLEKMMITLPGKMATKKYLATLATFVASVVLRGFKGFPTRPRKMAMLARMATLPGQVPQISQISGKFTGWLANRPSRFCGGFPMPGVVNKTNGVSVMILNSYENFLALNWNDRYSF